MSEINVLFVAGFGPVVRELPESKAFYVDALRLPLEAMPGNESYWHTGKIKGVHHFAMWPLSQAAESCFGKSEWPKNVREPTSWLEFDVEDVARATAALKQMGYEVFVDTREEPWGQTVSRLLSPEGILVGVTFTPWMR